MRHTLVLLTILTILPGSPSFAGQPSRPKATSIDLIAKTLSETIVLSSSDIGAGNDAVIAYFVDLVRLGGGGYRNTERSAFLVLDENDVLRCLLWPKYGGFQSETFHGRIPTGTVAIVHTHPKQLPYPSFGDRREATRLGIPFIVLSPRNINVVTTAGDVIEVVTNLRWMRDPSGSARGCEPLLEPVGSKR